MFKKTRIKLVILNTIVFFIILSTFGITLYFYMVHLINSDIDSRLITIAEEIQNNDLHEIKEHKREVERKIVYLFWNHENQLIEVIPENGIYSTDIRYFKQTLSHEQDIWSQSIDDHHYRIYKIDVGDRAISFTPSQSVKTIELIQNIDSETLVLRHLLYIILMGIILGLIISFLIGLFLANRSLMPIKRSWNKQTQFVADASHELRTPLSVIQTHLELLFHHPEHTIEEESLPIYISLQEIKRMNKLVSDLLTLAKTDSDQLLIERHWLQLDVLIHNVIQKFQPITDAKNMILSQKITNNISFYGDEDRLHQLLIILLDNAIKYTPENGEVHVSCYKEKNAISLTIDDTGIGIPSSEIPYIFDRFYRTDKSRSRTEGGVGLGLSIAKWIVHAHEGEIKVDSILHKGTKMTIHLPIKSI